MCVQSVCKIGRMLSLSTLPKCCPRSNSRVFSPTRRHSRLNSRDFIPTRTCTRSNSLDFSPTRICPRLNSVLLEITEEPSETSGLRTIGKSSSMTNFILKITGDLDLEGTPVIVLVSDEPSTFDEHVPNHLAGKQTITKQSGSRHPLCSNGKF